MTRKRVVAGLVLLASVGAGWQLGGAERGGHRSSEAAEVARLRSHFAQVERELLDRDVSALAPAQRAARAEQIRLLRVYAADGQFPHNDRFPGQRVPFFRDAGGTLCAMAFLIASSGRGDIVDHVAATRNNAYLPELIDEPGLADWLEQHGLTVAEAARIQPTYDGGGVGVIKNDNTSVGAGYVMATAAASGLSAATLFWNARSLERTREHRWSGGLGLAVGGIGIALGASRVGDTGGGNTELGSGISPLALRQRSLERGCSWAEPEPRAQTGARSPACDWCRPQSRAARRASDSPASSDSRSERLEVLERLAAGLTDVQ